MIHPLDELDRARSKRTAAFTGALQDLIRAVAARPTDSGRVALAQQRLGYVISVCQQWADILGRRRLLIQADKRMAKSRAFEYRGPLGTRTTSFGGNVTSQSADTVADVQFVEATEDMVSRDPRLANGYREVQQVYSYEHGFAVARSSTLEVTKKVQEVMYDALSRGYAVPSVSDIIAKLGDWSHAYGETVFRTNLNTAYSQGRVRQAFSTELDDFIPAFRRVPVGDSDTRPNHNFVLLANKRDPIWIRYATKP